MLARHDLALDDVELVNVNWSLAPSLMSRQVDAVIGAFRNFELNQLELEGVAGRCFYPEEEGVPAYDELIYVANPETMDADKVARFLAATERALDYMGNHPEALWVIFAGSRAELDDALNDPALPESGQEGKKGVKTGR